MATWKLTTRQREHYFWGATGQCSWPTLFLVYINDLCKLGIVSAKIIAFADDAAILFGGKSWSEAANYAEKGMSLVAKWLDDNLLTLNVSKKMHLCFCVFV